MTAELWNSLAIVLVSAGGIITNIKLWRVRRRVDRIERKVDR